MLPVNIDSKPYVVTLCSCTETLDARGCRRLPPTTLNANRGCSNERGQVVNCTLGLVLEIYSHTANDFLKGVKRRGAAWRRVGFRRRSVANDLAIGMLIN